MRLYFLRHTDALEGRDDAKRPLSPRGITEAHFLGFFLRRSGIQFDAAYTSPLVRARQTAEAVLAACGRSDPVKLELTKALLNETSQADFDRWLRRVPVADRVLLVGHAPSLPDRVCALLGVPSSPAFNLSKGGLACLDTEDRRSATLKLFVSPKGLGLK
jgi:phosphohistidine phosphatase